MKRFLFVERETLPPLAWCARIEQRAEDVVVYCGEGLERGESFFCEGAWSGTFAHTRFPEALTFTGSGAVIEDDKVVLCTPTHTLQAIYVLRREGELLCSNSLAFLLQRGEDDIDDDYRSYDLDLMSIMFGLKHYTRHIPSRMGRVELYYHCNLVITRDLKVLERPKRTPPAFVDYEAYRNFLQHEVDAVVSNAADSARKIRYSPVTTISSGYDSPACAVLGKAVECTQAVTFGKARSGEDDSGSRIAERLGLAVSEFDSQSYIGRSDQPEAEFVATGYGGDDVVVCALEALLPAKILFTGFHGDKVWGRATKPTSDIVRGDPSGGSLGEFRLRVGFINFPIPFIGCTQHEAIYQLSNSPQLRPWSLGEIYYDRPIPRRIVEEKGVPRHMFGQMKKAIARPYQTVTANVPELSRILSPDSYEDFRRFANGKRLFKNPLDQASFAVMHALYGFNLRIIRSPKLKYLFRSVGLNLPETTMIPWRFSRPRSWHSLMFHWGYAKIKARYRMDHVS